MERSGFESTQAIVCNPVAPKISGRREPHWDAVRAAFMLLGIPFHAAHPYRTDGIWLINSSARSDWLTILMQALHLFRMQGFFIIAGYFAAMLLARREPSEWARGRLHRLGVPLLFGLAVLVPMMNLLAELQARGVDAGLSIWKDQLWPLNRSTTGHLWFLIVLLYLSAGAAFVASFQPSRRLPEILPSKERRLERLSFEILLLSCLAIGAYNLLWSRAAERLLSEGSLASDVLTLSFAGQYAPYFVLGVVVQRTPGFRVGFNRFMPVLSLLGFSAALLLLLRLPSVPWALTCCLKSFAAVGLSQTFIALAYRAFSDERRWIKAM